MPLEAAVFDVAVFDAVVLGAAVLEAALFEAAALAEPVVEADFDAEAFLVALGFAAAFFAEVFFTGVCFGASDGTASAPSPVAASTRSSPESGEAVTRTTIATGAVSSWARKARFSRPQESVRAVCNRSRIGNVTTTPPVFPGAIASMVPARRGVPSVNRQ